MNTLIYFCLKSLIKEEDIYKVRLSNNLLDMLNKEKIMLFTNSWTFTILKFYSDLIFDYSFKRKQEFVLKYIYIFQIESEIIKSNIVKLLMENICQNKKINLDKLYEIIPKDKLYVRLNEDELELSFTTIFDEY